MALLIEAAAYRRWFLMILAGGFALRVIWALAVPIHPVSDSTVYEQLAWSIADRGAYAWPNGAATAYWPVGTAFIYSIPYRVFGHTFAPLAIVNVLVGTLSLALIMVIARRWLSSSAAIAAGAAYALWPSQIEFTSVLASELMFNLFLLLSLWAAIAFPSRSWVGRGLLAGLFLAAASYIRPTALPLVLLLAAALFWNRHPTSGRILRFIVSASVAMAICIAPWTIRNMRELGSPVLISTNGPANTWMGNNPNANGSYMPLPDEVSGMNEVARSHLLGERVKQFVADHPGRAASLFLRKLVITHDRETIGITWNEPTLQRDLSSSGLVLAKAASTAYWWIALILGAAGVGIIFAKTGWHGILHPAILGWFYFALVHAATVGADRYHFPSIPFIAMLSGLTLSELFQFARARMGNTLVRGRSAAVAN